MFSSCDTVISFFRGNDNPTGSLLALHMHSDIAIFEIIYLTSEFGCLTGNGILTKNIRVFQDIVIFNWKIWQFIFRHKAD